MAFPTVKELKNYLRVETTAEDSVLAALLAAATATVRKFLDRPIDAAARTYTIEDRRASSIGVGVLSSDPRTGVRTLRIPDTPIAASPAPIISDRYGTVVDAATYRVDLTTGVVRADSAPGIGFSYGFALFPYTVVATTGLATADDYADVAGPIISQGILDVAADLYHRRNPAATAELAGGGTAVHYGRAEEALPIRYQELLGPLRRPLL